MPPPKKDGMSGAGKGDVRGQNGNRSNFHRTDQAISNSRFNERVLKPWVPDSTDAVDGSLEKSSGGGGGGGGGGWDQFAENERLFGLTTDYDESIYTTTINKSHPQYRQRIANADKWAREIEQSTPTTAHVAEERVMDYVGGKDQTGEDEEDKYSGVRRQDFPPLGSSRENKYTPPAKRAPTGQSTVKGAPVDPAIIDAQLRVVPKKQQPPIAEQPKPTPANSTKNGVSSKPNAESSGPAEPKASGTDNTGTKSTTPVPKKPFSPPAPSQKPAEATNTPAKTSTTVSRTISPASPSVTPSATSTVERDVLKEFKTFATQQRKNAEQARSSKMKADKEVKLTELKKFASSFKLTTPVPNDLVSIIAKDPLKQKEIQAKAMKNAEEMAKVKASETIVVKDKPATAKDAQAKPAEQTPAPSAESRPPRAAAAPQVTPPTGTQNRNTGPRQPYNNQPQYHGQNYRNNRGPPHGPQQQTGNLAQRIRNLEHHKYGQPAHAAKNAPAPEMRLPPTGPANDTESNYHRRHSAMPNHMGAKLNPNSHEFKPSAFAATFSPNGPISTSSSPRSMVNNVTESPPVVPSGQLIRRKTKAVDVNKCNILSHMKTISPPTGRKWDDNGGLRPSYDTLPTWRQLQDDEKPESTMHLTYKEYFERQPFAGQSMSTPNPSHVVPQLPHQHQLPFHLQHGGHNMGPRQSPHMPPMQMHTPQHSHAAHPASYGNDDHRMMHSNSAQSFASPRLGHAPVAYPGQSPAQAPYNQPVFMGPGTPQMGQYRSFSNTPQYMPPQQGHMMMQPHFIPGGPGMVGGPQMMYPGGPPQFMPPSGPPQPGPGASAYPSSGRPTAPMMGHQGSQQGQPAYGMSPNVQYSQPAYVNGQQGGPMNNTRGYNGVAQQYSSSPQQGHQFASQQRNGSATSFNNGGKNYPSGPAQQHGQGSHGSPAVQQSRPSEGNDEAK
jgi:hypothetical protein